MQYKIFAALHEEATAGWVWLATPKLLPHRLITIEKEHPYRKIFCECRMIDQNFIKLYNERPRTRDIDSAHFEDVLVIGDWYRTALGIVSSSTEVELKVTQPQLSAWTSIKAGTQHADPNVRLANRLGLIGTWLGISGVVFSLVTCRLYAGIAVLVLGLMTVYVCKGIHR
jgi:hypothetical protein